MSAESEGDLLPLSGLQHLRFCRRQCALIHVEQAWTENRSTAEGRLFHERVHSRENETRGGVRTARGLRLRSRSLGLAGVADAVEFHPAEVEGEGVRLPGTRGGWTPFPVEYKRGRPKKDDCDALQLCAQAMCLEEMLGCPVPRGALFYGATRKRLDVEFAAALRDSVRLAAEEFRALVASGRTPPPEFGPKCRDCSFREECLPEKLSGSARSVEDYLHNCVAAARREAT